MDFTQNLPAIQSSSPAFLGMPTQHEMMAYQAYAKVAVDSQMYRGAGKEAAVMMIILAAREYGIPPCQALNKGLQIIEGNVELSSRMMSALIRRSKHQLKITPGQDECTVWGKRKDTGEELSITYTMDMAQRAGLIKDKGSWKKSQEDMLFARAMSRLARQLFSDTIGIGYIEGEISGEQHVSVTVNEQTLEYTPEIQELSEENLLQEILSKFDKDDQYYMMEFIKVVSNHYKWTVPQTIKEFLKDMNRTVERFHEWKNQKEIAA